MNKLLPMRSSNAITTRLSDALKLQGRRSVVFLWMIYNFFNGSFLSNRRTLKNKMKRRKRRVKETCSSISSNTWIRISLKRNSFYVTLGISRILHNYGTNDAMEIYNIVVQNPDRVHDDYYYRSRKGVLMKELKACFGELLETVKVNLSWAFKPALAFGLILLAMSIGWLFYCYARFYQQRKSWAFGYHFFDDWRKRQRARWISARQRYF